jgi:HSP20 family protein
MVRTVRHPLAQFIGEVNRLQDVFNNFSAKAVPPAISVWSDDDAFHAETDLPGIDPATLDITVTDGTQLVIRGERKLTEPEGAACLRQERAAGTFSREVTLPSLVDSDKVEARYELGVLKLTLPKSAAAKPRKIVVKS